MRTIFVLLLNESKTLVRVVGISLTEVSLGGGKEKSEKNGCRQYGGHKHFGVSETSKLFPSPQEKIRLLAKRVKVLNLILREQKSKLTRETNQYSSTYEEDQPLVWSVTVRRGSYASLPESEFSVLIFSLTSHLCVASQI